MPDFNYKKSQQLRSKILHTILFFVLFKCWTAAQLSPGDLANSHAHLEGISNCTQCHVLGEKVSNDKCLACHAEIKTRLDQCSGFHASKEVKTKDCATCHSDHHGRKFDMVRFDENSFDHDLTGYELTGAHTKIDCRQCHVPDYIVDAELKKREETYLGLSNACINCHEDYHQKTLDNDCAKCHAANAFSPAEKFDHEQTDFVLNGKHKAVECIDCHQMEIRNGKEFQQFAEVPFGNCNSCHDDVHNNNLGTDCKQCHTEQTFTSHSRLSRFKHNRTKFPLKGKHKQVDCFSCHSADASPLSVFQDNLGTMTNDCASCHEDVHEGKFGNNCTDCHTEESFKVAADLDNFNHDLTGFELEGKHEVVDCRKCHVSESFTEALPHNDCASCHVDYHEGEFADHISSPGCADCHTVNGFALSNFTIENHEASNFPLEGAHLATPCFACHLQEDKWHFKNIGERCVDCHADIHEGEIAEKFYPNQSCESCHVSESWKDKNSFDHEGTAFVLEGIHLQQPCSACHLRDEKKPYGHFTGLSQTCTACHENVHGSQFEVDQMTDCTKCHGFESWDASHFNHNNTAFPLEGKHVELDCGKCHLETVVGGDRFVEYKMESFECLDCHQ